MDPDTVEVLRDLLQAVIKDEPDLRDRRQQELAAETRIGRHIVEALDAMNLGLALLELDELARGA